MKVDRMKALSATVGGKQYWFCSAHCRATFTGEEHHHAGHDHEESAETTSARPARAASAHE